jgi:tRNA nucleotidyltransferase (CCA-adding enzyme)
MITQHTKSKLVHLAAGLQLIPQSPAVAPFLVGGCVRDALLGLPVKDLDVEVHNLPFAELVEFLEKNKGPEDKLSVHGEFVVAQLTLSDGTDIEFSVPRMEKANSAGGHTGFDIEENPFGGIGAATRRRDLTINALMISAQLASVFEEMAFNKLRMLVIPECQYFLEDISRDKVVMRPVSSAFEEDPLRVLRVMRFLSKIPNAEVSEELIQMCHNMKDQFKTLSIERVFGEWNKMFMTGDNFSKAFLFLCISGWIEHFPRLDAMASTEQQREWHPEGDVFTHTAHCLNAAVEHNKITQLPDKEFQEVMWALLLHDAWKPETFMIGDDGKIHNPDHDGEAGRHGAQWLREQFDVPLKVAKAAAKLAEVHMCHAGMNNKTNFRKSAKRLARKVEGLVTPEQIRAVIFADLGGRPPLTLDSASSSVDKVLKLTRAMQEIQEKNDGKLEIKPWITGNMIIDAGVSPGPLVGKIKDMCLEDQINEQFTENQAQEHLTAVLSKVLGD